MVWSDAFGRGVRLLAGGLVYPRIYLDARKAGEQLGWQATTRLDAGLAETAEYFRRGNSR